MKKLLGMIVAVAAAGALVAAPVDAAKQKPLSGPMDLDLYAELCAVPHAPPFLTWAGTVELDGVTYGFADFPTAPFVEDGKFIYFEEYWTMFTLDEGEAVTPEIACDTTRVVLAGVNDGWGTPGGTGKAATAGGLREGPARQTVRSLRSSILAPSAMSKLEAGCSGAAGSSVMPERTSWRRSTSSPLANRSRVASTQQQSTLHPAWSP